MPRSGTSMTAAIFARLGYFVAEDEKKQLRKGDEYNPAGYFEAEPLIEANAKVFSAAGFPFDNSWLYEPINSDQAHAIFAVPADESHKQLVAKYDHQSPWVWKDPRLCYTLAYWWPMMDPTNTVVLLLKRDPGQIFQSFLRVNWRHNTRKDKQDTFKRIEEHIAAAELAIQKFSIPHITIHYSDYSQHPFEVAQRMSEFFSIELDASQLGYSNKLNNSTLRGKFMRLVDTTANLVPDRIRKFIKACIPKRLIRLIFTGRS